jgi:hypothetical protein
MNPPQQIPPGRPVKFPAATGMEITVVPDSRLLHGYSPGENCMQESTASTVPGGLIISIQITDNMYYDLIF